MCVCVCMCVDPDQVKEVDGIEMHSIELIKEQGSSC